MYLQATEKLIRRASSASEMEEERELKRCPGSSKVLWEDTRGVVNNFNRLKWMSVDF